MRRIPVGDEGGAIAWRQSSEDVNRGLAKGHTTRRKARILTKVEDLGVWPEGLSDACIAMIPKTDGDATPLGQRPLSVLPISYLGFCLNGSS